MMERPLLTADELKSLKKGNFVVMKTGVHPMRSRLRLFLDWGIFFGEPYITEEKSHRKVYYADKNILEYNIMQEFSALIMQNQESEIESKETEKTEPEKTKCGGTNHSPTTDKAKRHNKNVPNKNIDFKAE